MLVLSMHPEDRVAARLLKAGADGYLNKEEASDRLVAAIRRVLGGQKYVSPDLASRLASDLSGGAGREPHEDLSDREFQVLCLLGQGRSVSDIADELSLSVKTVSTYRSRLLGKMEDPDAPSPREVTVTSNYATELVRRRCLEAGADHFLDKASDFGALADLIAAAADSIGEETP